MAKKIMLIRHAEKPDKDDSIHGVDESGSQDPDELSVRGWQRAGALVRLFAARQGSFAHPALATPDTIFACSPRGHAKSVRSQRTVEPLARFLEQVVDLRYGKGEEDKLVRAVASAPGVALVAWEHDALPPIAAAIVDGSCPCPNNWPDSRFDVVWVLDQSTSSTWTLTQVPQLALPGDRDVAIAMTSTA